MAKILHATVVGLGLAAGAVFSVQAQSVSSLPPGADAATQTQTARTAPFGSTQSVFPKPGGSGLVEQQPTAYAAPQQQNPAPTSQVTVGDPAQHPYSGGMGPKPN
ncbi:MAG: hypothetical protein WB611_05060 [Stellaceae bacterium]